MLGVLPRPPIWGLRTSKKRFPFLTTKLRVMTHEVLDPFHERLGDSIHRRRTAGTRSKLFITSAIFYWVVSTIILILIPVAMGAGRFFSIFNRANYVEVANLFLQADFYLQGHCLTFVDYTVQCKKVPFYETFYKMPYWGNVSGKMTLTDLAGLLSSVSVQNPIVFDILFLTELATVGCIATSILAWKRMTRKAIGRLIAVTGLLLTLTVATTIASSLIYSQRLPEELDRIITVDVTKDGQTFNVTGRLSDIGIRFATSDGMNMVYGILIMGITLLGISIRWLFEGSRSGGLQRSDNTRIRTVYF